jgi:hypothetical protein
MDQRAAASAADVLRGNQTRLIDWLVAMGKMPVDPKLPEGPSQGH